MLYRPLPRPSALARIAGVLAVFGTLLGSLRRTAGDKRYLDDLNARELADLGLSRFEDDRWRHLY
jgi:uncharacterized protein YjiS (DUF1127 family)